MKKILFLYLFYCAVVMNAVSYMPVHLTKLFYHQGTLGDKVVCYFDKAPLCNKIPHADGEGQKEVREKLEFFLPMAIFASNDARKMLEKVNSTKREHYSIAITEEEKPVKGVKVSIEYDPQHIVCDYATCDSISAQKSVVFSFNNKKSLEAIKVHNGAILRSAHNKPGVRPHIMLDFGHGGEDAGKVGCNMVKEKV